MILTYRLLIVILRDKTVGRGEKKTINFGGVKSYMWVFHGVGVGAPNPHIQGSTVQWIFVNV